MIVTNLISVQSEALAREHWWAALDFMPGNQIAEYGHFQMTGPLDYESVMIYPHFMGAKPGTRVITRLDGVNGGEVFAGGNPFTHLQRPSPGDVARIGVLYPLPHHLRPHPPIHPRSEADTIRNTAGSAPTPTEWKPLSVVIPGLVNTVIKPAPTYGPEEIAKAKKDYDSCSQCQTAIMNSDIIWPSEDDLQDERVE